MIPIYSEVVKSIDNTDESLIKEFEEFIVPYLKNFNCSKINLHCLSKYLPIMENIKVMYAKYGWSINYTIDQYPNEQIDPVFILTISGIK